MHKKQLRNIDLNLLKALSALLDERSVTTAAHKVGLSQSAMSRALGRLRKQFNDQLLVRTAKSNMLTPYAEALKPELDQVMRGIIGLLTPEAFDPQFSSVKFQIAINDYAGSVVLPRLGKHIRDHKYNIDLEVFPRNQKTIDLIEQGDLDLAIGSFSHVPDSYFRQSLFRDRLVCLVRADHPILEKRMTLKTYLNQTHLTVSLDMQGGRPVDAALKAMGKERHVKMNIPFFSAAPSLLKSSDMILTLPKLLATEFQTKGLTIIDLPVKLPHIEISQIWHPRLNSSAAHQWLRMVIKDRTHTTSA